MKTIYNTYVPMESQAQCDRMKQVCVDNGLRGSHSEFAFRFSKRASSNHLYYNENLEYFAVAWETPKTGTQVTESEWLELLKTTK